MTDNPTTDTLVTDRPAAAARMTAPPVTDELDVLFAQHPEIVTVQEVAALLRVNKAGVYRWLKNGSVPGYRRGHTWFIVRDELKTWMRHGSNQNHPAPAASTAKITAS